MSENRKWFVNFLEGNMKKEYKAPEMEVLDLKHQAPLLSGSNECTDGDYCDELGFDIRSTDHPKA